MKKFLVVMSYLALASSLWATDFSLNPARDFGAIRRINPTDYDGKSVVREDGTGLSSDTAAAFRAALEVFSKAEAEPAGAIATHDALTAVHGVSEVADAADLSAHIASTGTAVHGLGTMAAEKKTDYVATGTFTGHAGDKANPHEVTYTQTGALASSAKAVDSDKLDGLDSTDYVATSTLSAHVTDNSDVHGCTAIASASAVADALSAANASDALNLRLDGSRVMTGNLKFSGNYGILQSTSDGADNNTTRICGGGDASSSRGGGVYVFGNEYTNNGGQINYYAGNVSTGHHIFATAAGTERMRLTYGGNLLIGTTTDDGTNKLQVNGPVYVASYVSALGYIDRTEAPDTLAEAYAIVQSHDVTADGELDHSKLHPAAWGKRVELRPTRNTITRTIEEPIQDAEQLKDGSLLVKEKIIEEPEMEQIVVPDQSGRDLSMVISAQALVIKDLTKRIEALEATR